MTVEHVSGKKVGRVMLYALSTCVWCKKTKALLDSLGVDYDYEYVDLLQGDEKKKAVNTITKWNPGGSFPTMIINDKKCVIGFREDEIREALKL
jgi:glutaredoxin-like protein NrdH